MGGTPGALKRLIVEELKNNNNKMLRSDIVAAMEKKGKFSNAVYMSLKSLEKNGRVKSDDETNEVSLILNEEEVEEAFADTKEQQKEKAFVNPLSSGEQTLLDYLLRKKEEAYNRFIESYQENPIGRSEALIKLNEILQQLQREETDDVRKVAQANVRKKLFLETLLYGNEMPSLQNIKILAIALKISKEELNDIIRYVMSFRNLKDNAENMELTAEEQSKFQILINSLQSINYTEIEGMETYFSIAE